MGTNLAASEPNHEFQEFTEVAPHTATPLPYKATVEDAAARLYGQGYKRSEVAKILKDQLTLGWHGKEEYRARYARAKLRKWERNQVFRDKVYQQAVVDVDMATPGILKGVVKKAKAGRVDAARLALELTGRHNPKGDAAPTQVAVVINGIPRPGAQAVAAIDGASSVVVNEVEE